MLRLRAIESRFGRSVRMAKMWFWRARPLSMRRLVCSLPKTLGLRPAGSGCETRPQRRILSRWLVCFHAKLSHSHGRGPEQGLSARRTHALCQMLGPAGGAACGWPHEESRLCRLRSKCTETASRKSLSNFAHRVRSRSKFVRRLSKLDPAWPILCRQCLPESAELG